MVTTAKKTTRSSCYNQFSLGRVPAHRSAVLASSALSGSNVFVTWTVGP